MALGLSEICLPEQAMIGLSAEEQRSLIAHELAHLRRVDPLWLILYGLLERVFFFQPLNRLARKQLQDSAEELCDAWVLNALGTGLPLASGLVKVAGWLCDSNHPQVLAGALGRSHLADRVQHLLGDQERDPGAAAFRARTTALAFALATTVGAPLITIAAPAAEQLTASARPPIEDATGGRGQLREAPDFTSSRYRGSDEGAWAGAEQPGGRMRAELDNSSSRRKPWALHADADGETRFTFETEEEKRTLRIFGSVEFAGSDPPTIQRIVPGGRLVIEQIDQEGSRQLRVVPGSDGRPIITYKLNGRQRGLDADARAWLEPQLVSLYRAYESLPLPVPAPPGRSRGAESAHVPSRYSTAGQDVGRQQHRSTHCNQPGAVPPENSVLVIVQS